MTTLDTPLLPLKSARNRVGCGRVEEGRGGENVSEYP
jgi:hypothetical protein